MLYEFSEPLHDLFRKYHQITELQKFLTYFYEACDLSVIP